ncbi:DUF7504 family protein [Halorussus halophilus]|uniref:DUF7504 family protein n=1 Tax=Halorussus halophilus TaxID=2650975 RepID=UPI00130187CA|nr:hypothetical protein [Halorussus halophilus]
MSGGSTVRGDREADPPDEYADFLSVLHELKSTGCNLLVVGDVTDYLYTKASSRLLGDADITRYRLLAVTDATTQSIADRLPGANETPRPLPETTQIINHAGAPRSVTTATNESTPRNLAGIPEISVADPELRGLQRTLIEQMDEFADQAEPSGLNPTELRVGIDSLDSLFEQHDEDVVLQALGWIGQAVTKYDGMAHYILRENYTSERVQALAGDMDAIIEIRSVDPVEHEHEAEQRWHVPERELTTDWHPL